MKKYLLIEDEEKLKEKIKENKFPLNKWWTHFLNLAEFHDKTFPLFSGLAYVVTEDLKWANIFKKNFLVKIYSLPFLDYSIGVQYHTWCFANPISRYAIIYDWVFESGVFNKDEIKKIEKLLLEFTFKHPYMVLQGRVKLSDNQIMSMCFACGLIGYIFGYKRGDNYIGKELFAYAIDRFPELVGLFPKGGYSLEGSTYMHQVVSPTVTFWCAFLEQLTGNDYFNRKFPPNEVSIRDILEMENKLIGPSGLLPPWDHYGYHRAINKSPLVFLARKTMDPGILKKIICFDMWNEDDEIAWGKDDKLWTILWWPEEISIKDGIIPFKNWCIENVGASFELPGKKIRFFQFWDKSGYGYHVGRAQVNPNSIIFEAYGSPLLVDGIPDREKCSYFDYPVEKILSLLKLKKHELEDIISFHKEIGNDWNLQDWLKSWSYGCIGSSNSIIIDSEGWYTPEKEKEGKMILFGETDLLKGVKSDVTDYYNPRYNIHRMTRTSFFVRNSYIIVFDRAISKKNHSWIWQVFTRPDFLKRGKSFLIKTKEGVGCYVIPFEKYDYSVSHIEGFPVNFEKESYLLQFHKKGKTAEFKMLFYPFCDLEVIDDITKGWEIGYLHNPDEFEKVWDKNLRLERISFSDVPYYFVDKPYKFIRKKLNRNFLENERIFLYFEKSSPDLTIWINNRKIDKNYEPLLPFICEITPFLRYSDNWICIVLKNRIEKSIGGKCKLLKFCERPFKASIKGIDKDVYKIKVNEHSDTIVIDNKDEVITEEFQTDGWGLIIGKKDFSGIKVSFLKTDNCLFISNKKIDVEWKENTFFVRNLEKNLEVCFKFKNKFLSVRTDEEKAEIDGSHDIRFTFQKTDVPIIFVNKVFMKPEYNPQKDRFELVISHYEKKKEKMDEIEKAIFFGFKKDTQSRKYLEKLLFSKDFLVRCASILSLGKRKERKSVNHIIKVFKEEIEKEKYPPLSDLKEIKNPDDPNLQEKYVKRWRFIMCCIIALGEIKDKKSLPLLYKVLLERKDFYPVFVNAIKYIKNVRDKDGLKFIEKYKNYCEINTKIIANETVKTLRKK